MSLAFVDYVVLALYLAAMLAMGAILALRIKEFKDYFLAGGALTTPLLLCSLVSTYYELDVTFATSERGFYDGLVAWFWWTRPYYLAIFIAAFLLVRRLRHFKFMTLPDVLERYYGRPARVTGALACFIYSLPITAIAGMSAMFSALGWPRDIALSVIVGVCAIYTLSGGLWADSVTDTFQFLLMCVSLAVTIPLALDMVGGFDFLAKLPAGHLTATGGVDVWLIVAWSTGALTVFVEPAFYQRIFAAKDEKSIRNALLMGLVLWAAYDWGVTIVGMIARGAVESGILPASLQGKEALMSVCMLALPVGLKGLFVAGVMAAAMSSVDSYSLLASGNLVYDIIRPVFKPDMSDKWLIRLTRAGVLVVMLLGVVISLWFERISDAWVFMAAVLVSVVFIPMAGALFLKPKRVSGILASGAGLAALAGFYAAIYVMGVYDPEEESYVWRAGSMEIWREYSVLFALPVSAAAFALGEIWGKKR